MLPACCLPLWGREGVTLLAATENKRMMGKRGFQQSQIMDKSSILWYYIRKQTQCVIQEIVIHD